MRHQERIERFVRGIFAWFPRNKRALPWRDLKVKDRRHRAYLVLVSEVMLQQTQVSRVIVLYKNFIQKFPRIEDLAKASNSEILIAWRGLGYNARALRLRDAARKICRDDGGRFPDTLEGLQQISGIGPYTAAAVMNFAFGTPTPCVDTNIRRILHRFFVGMESADGTWVKGDAYLLRLSDQILREVLRVHGKEVASKKRLLKSDSSAQGGDRTSADWFAALMDFGSLVCTKSHPKWELFNEDLKLSCKSYGSQIKRTKKLNKKEPGVHLSGTFVPRRILRGRVVEALRDHPKGLKREGVLCQITHDDHADHHHWLEGILEGLTGDGMIRAKNGRYFLA